MTRMEGTTGKLVLLVQVEEEYGSHRVVGRVARLTDDGELLGANWSYGGWDLGAEYDGLQIAAWLGSAAGMAPLESERGVWGMGYRYRPSSIDSAKQAKAIASTMGRIERGLNKLDEEMGYLTKVGEPIRDDYAGYLLRVGRVLKIKDVWVRNLPHRQAMTGDPHWHVTGTYLQHWVDEVDKTAREGHTRELIRR